MNIPEDLLYAESHEWLRLEGDIATIGITDHAQHELSDVVHVDVPKVGTKFSAKGIAAVIESVKAASDIYAPVGGEVVEANAELSADPAIVNNDAYGKGWLFKLKITDRAELEKLLTAEKYAAQIGA